MALIFTGTTSTGFTVTTNGNTIVTRQDRSVAADGRAFNFGATDSNEYFLRGDVFAATDGITASSGANNLSVVVGLGASVIAGSDGVALLVNSVNDRNHRVTNDGSIIGEGSDGVDIRGVDSTVTNNGFISGAIDAVSVFGGFSEVLNTGRLVGLSGARIVGDFAEIYNSGEIVTRSLGISVNGESGLIANQGSVSSGFTGISMNGPGEIVNTGTVTGDDFGVSLSTSAGEFSRLVNTGTITAIDDEALDFAVSAGFGNETIVNSGTIVGRVRLNSGDDTYKGETGFVTGEVLGGNGNDSILGGENNDRFFGEADNDTLRGQQGDDVLDGGGGNDQLRGGQRDDKVFGGAAADTLFGGQGDDTLNGGNGTDTLYGGKGDDTLTGGTKADTFVFGTTAGNDVITDFQNGSDLIDVQAFGFGGFGGISAAVSTVNGGTLIDWEVIGGSGQLFIEGVTGAINGADFIF